MSAKTLNSHPLFLLPIILVCFGLLNLASAEEKIQAAEQTQKIFLPSKEIQIETKTQFSTKLSQKKMKVPFEVKYLQDSNLEWGKIQKIQEGVSGTKLQITQNLFWKGKWVGKRMETKLISQSVPQINLIGKKITPGEIDTPNGKLAYKGKMRVFATSYDKNCRGCNETTATGARLSYGIVAVDPRFIPLGSKVYVPGYGTALAADTGGAIKGPRIDLAYDDVKNGFWRSRWTEVYLLE